MYFVYLIQKLYHIYSISSEWYTRSYHAIQLTTLFPVILFQYDTLVSTDGDIAWLCLGTDVAGQSFSLFS